MKVVVFLGDGMADHPQAELDNHTPLQVANIPTMDRLAQEGYGGLVRTIPAHLPAGSDTANLAAMGFDADKYYTGRSPIEAANLGLTLSATDVALRCNLVTLSDEADFAERRMLDYSAGEVTTDEARQLIDAINREFATDRLRFHTGTAYRHCLVWQHGHLGIDFTPPHNITGQKIADWLPREMSDRQDVVDGAAPAGADTDAKVDAAADAAEFLDLTIRINRLLTAHPVNRARVSKGLNPANSIWLWGAGTRLFLPPFLELYGLPGTVISGVDLVKGIGKTAGMQVPVVPGATGGAVTDYAAKARAALEALSSGSDFVYIHVEAPDECGHHGDAKGKIAAIEAIDREIVAPIWSELERHKKETGEPYCLILLPDHATPLELGAHTREPVPFAVYWSDAPQCRPVAAYDEVSCAAGGQIEQGHDLLRQVLARALPEA